MKASRLIARLQKLVEKHGDVPVTHYLDGPVTGAQAWTDDGEIATKTRPASHILLKQRY